MKTLASQLNGCAYCVHMHTREARAAGESEERLYLLSAWRGSPLYSARERAALAWTESLTLLATSHAPDDVYADLAREFTTNSNRRASTDRRRLTACPASSASVAIMRRKLPRFR